MFRLWRIFWRSAMLEWRTIATERLERVMLIWLPAFSIGFVWYTFSIAQVRDLPIGVQNKDNTALSRQLERFVDTSPNVAIVAHYSNPHEAQQALKDEAVYAVLVIPKDFSQHIKQTKVSPVVLNVNAQFGTHSGIVQSGVSSAVRTFSAGVELSLRKKMGMSEEQARAALMPLRPNVKMAFNLSLNYQIFLASNVIPALLHVLATLVGVGAIGRELRHKTLGHWFRGVCGRDGEHTVTFFAMLSAMLGKLFWQMLLFSLWIALTLWLISREVSVAPESLMITGFAAWMMILLSLWLGVILTTLTMSKRLGLSLAGFITAPAFAFSGVTFPIVSMPAGAQTVSSLLPLTHYLQLHIAQIQTHMPWRAALPSIYLFALAIIGMALLATILGLLALKRKSSWGKR